MDIYLRENAINRRKEDGREGKKGRRRGPFIDKVWSHRKWKIEIVVYFSVVCLRSVVCSLRFENPSQRKEEEEEESFSHSLENVEVPCL